MNVIDNPRNIFYILWQCYLDASYVSVTSLHPAFSLCITTIVNKNNDLDLAELRMTIEEYLEKVIESVNDQPFKGIAQQAIDKGYDSLSVEQENVIEQSGYIMSQCPICNEEIEFEDMDMAIFYGKCAQCQRDWDMNYVDK